MDQERYQRAAAMSRRLIFIVEGETEKEFVENLLVPRFNSELGVYDITCFKTKRSHGGVSKYSYIREDILQVVNERDAIVTTMFDFYMIPRDTLMQAPRRIIFNK